MINTELRSRWCLAKSIFIPFMLCLTTVSCSPTAIPNQANENMSGQTGGNVNGNVPANDEPNDNEPSAPTDISSDEIENLAEDAILTVSRILAISSPVGQIAGIIVDGNSPPACPELVLTMSEEALTVQFEYDDGCTPSFLNGQIAMGIIGGEYYPATGIIDFEVFSAGFSGQAVSGIVAGSTSAIDAIVEFSAGTTLQTDELNISGQVSAAFDQQTSQLQITDGLLNIVYGSTTEFSLTLNRIQVSFNEGSGNILVGNGTISYATDTEPQTIQLMFP